MLAQVYNMAKKTLEQFVEDSKKIHGDFYDYSKVIYETNKTKVEITCPKHGSFWQVAKSHYLRGDGCYKCSKERLSELYSFTVEQFVENSRKVHGNKYDYSKVIYKKSGSKVEVICPEHGSFYPIANNHIRGSSCPTCSGKIRTTLEHFVEKAKEIHNNEYDYSKVEYKTVDDKIEIICLKHGSFWQTPYSHTGQKCGCPKCYGSEMKTIEQFIEEARKIHKNKFDYSKVEYLGAHKKIEIICPKHGAFFQRPNTHTNGKGCLRCTSNISKPETAWLNSLNIPDDKEHRQVRIKTPSKTYTVDGFEPETNTIYEFLGDFWHGNLKRYSANKINKHNKKTMKQLNDEIVDKLFILGNSGYNVEFIWESDFKC